MLQAKGQAVWQQFSERYPQQAEALQVFAPDIIVGFSLSDFIADSCLKDAELLSWLFIDKQLSCAQPDYANYWSQIHEIQDEANLAQHLRRFRRRWMVQLAWRDLTHQQSIAQSLTDVSALADTLINGAYHWLYADMCSKHGMPMGSLGPQPMLIWGMGKLGGQELNFSSDIDLIFAYPEPGETDARRGLEHQIWFQRLAQKLIAALHQITADGQVFRVDMRLRPFGDSGPIVSHFAALEDYYQQQGRDWERYAMLKARIINPDGRYSEQLEQIRRPFVFRRYIDFSAIESLRRMKSMISQEVRRRQLTNNIKLGAGGIREIEFIVQSLQLIRAGRQASLQTRNLLQTLQVMEQEQVLEASDCQALRDCYLYLRRVEHYLQQFNDAQTQTLPDDGLNQQRLCRVCEVADFSALLAQVQGVMAEVSHHFELLIGEEAEGASSCDAEFNDAWLLELSDNEAQALLADKLSQTQIADLW
ncbi:bifunctional [glutamate--ammonia ligase]-adenylyl-L-tyrosine phosphorylase/[glutamate--ammonia-ligase] adenylyltransferase [Pseudobowmanella zhangzhouensis]